ncbi:UDP-glucose 4-epimerase GalE [Desulfofustis glycolicus]|uniref:UDP-glucose 4-epimerase n=1 Tax=Desulfofustis glycolicus DSM 9705 TaxID=1121409 RepID=A0A1M5Y6R3_9BACT|nr:UDP-glucose 4-epimerase GalE [Desulfofustis glycolicus]MCB2216867.1 UDP-glucose 4-epimerase GalE [Desulfobulbaceae bacterium]SHI07785.1 UDP-L-arabinose 4-epimerase [Desulfofustis glycolicus DSM 9705]
MKSTILVTGGAGYIGSHTCKALRDSDCLPVAYDNLVYGHREAAQWGPLEYGDILDHARLDQVFRLYQPEAVIHFAAYAYVGESVVDPGKYYQNNVAGTINLLESMRRHGCRMIIFSSTCASFGLPKMIPIGETAEQNPINPYGRSKLMIEQILKDYDGAYGIRHIALRYFNAAGADPEGVVGEDHEPETHLIPLVIDAALGRRECIEIFGTDYPTPDGTAIRDYVHVTDLADAHVRAVDKLRRDGSSDQFNLGTGTGTSVRQIIQSVETISRCTVPVREGHRRPGDPPELVADPRKALQFLDWRPRFSELETIVGTAFRWHEGGGFRGA